jgi:hypothetical protein
MARTPRRSFPKVHSLYLSREQDARLRRFAQKSGESASEIMRAALDLYLERTPRRRRRSDDEPTHSETRHAIAESARARKFVRGPRNAPVWPNYQVADRTPVWSAPTGWRMRDDASAGPHPLAHDANGHPFDPPANAVAWLVMHQQHPRGQPAPITWHGSDQVVLIALDSTEAQLTRLIGRRLGWLILHPVDAEGRLLRARQGIVAYD